MSFNCNSANDLGDYGVCSFGGDISEERVKKSPNKLNETHFHTVLLC